MLGSAFTEGYMNQIIVEAITDTIKDTATLIPFLFITYLIMEWLEGKTETHSAGLLSRVGKGGYVIGSGIGLIPQCGFSAAAASLYSGGVITVGTMMSVFLATSDEMIPIFISSMVSPKTIFKILAFKFIIALISGFTVDALYKALGRRSSDKHIHDLCEQDGCGCEDGKSGLLRSALVHTMKITIFIFLISLLLSLAVSLAGRQAIAEILTGTPVLGIFIAGLIGLIPNCAASVAIAELYLEGMLTPGQMMTGLLVSAGVGILVLGRTNRHHKENIRIIATLYAIGVLWGLVIDAASLSF